VARRAAAGLALALLLNRPFKGQKLVQTIPAAAADVAPVVAAIMVRALDVSNDQFGIVKRCWKRSASTGSRGWCSGGAHSASFF